MALLRIIKLSEGVWKHWSDKDGFFALTRLYAKIENDKFLIVEYYGAKRRDYLVTEIEVYNIGGSAETFSNFDDLQIRLKELNYIGYDANFPYTSVDDTANHFKGGYDIITNNPVLSNGTGNLGDEYRCSVAGTRDFGSGDVTVGIGDILIYEGTEWIKKVNNNQLTDSNFGEFSNSLTTEDTIADGDLFNFTDVSDSNKQKKTDWSNIKAKLKTYFDTFYQVILTDVNFGAFINGLTSKTTPVDADSVSIVDSADSNKQKKVSFTNLKAFLKTYFDSIYTVQGYATISSNTSLDDTYHGKTIWVTATCNITIPSGLRSDFNASFRTFTGVTATFLTSGTTINSESDTSVVGSKKMCYLAVYSTNNYIISGG